MNPVLETRGITKNFGAVEASRGISLDLRPGEIHALIGPNGAGKSTLIQQIAGKLRPDAGSVHLLGEDVTALGVAERARAGLGRTFQVSALAMEDTVLQNAVLGALGARGGRVPLFRGALHDADLRATAEAALDRVDLLDSADMQTAALSHGQRRQLEVAVALTLKPRAFVMDEPMAGLGAEGSARLTRFLDGLRDEAPILMVEHDMDAVFALADRISVLVYGQLIATGTRDEIRANPDVRAAYLGEDA
ncbi:ABC transporter ATP-binding protein [Thalassobacter stenotrophicus]|uniref:Galactose/methyl galactoside import ATP-binding protein MglA n=2 Tax=Thalassobacter stenotrophicus TaxID=266809 RepID=A0A0P1FKQ4_9RHOB|nr:ABC transporter ATP-binding protein [Thalassobacter stenotrophicus]PVZ49769.1 ABC transporter ATP-binding protein [Thalassobacter stenotrophicus]CUH59783.1 Galactose/methyl galactoside import ATP-binding protein MglA [Thalassobacter stenotrophicus]SHI89289.1 amino acid/amide ABC transporter ATP-binding protein 1, HAAT family [Thalassobacter stenotrophicus DSM 16310]